MVMDIIEALFLSLIDTCYLVFTYIVSWIKYKFKDHSREHIVDDVRSVVHYTSGPTKYMIASPVVRRKASNVLSVHDDTGNDVTTIIESFAGPHRNFHSIRTTPRLLGFRSLTVKTIDDEEIIYERDSVIESL